MPHQPLQRPIGVFDSGVGGLSILRALRHELPHDDFVYLADSGHAPYGERDVAFVQERSHRLVRHLRQRHGIGLLVVACNTATALAIEALRAEHPDLPIVGVEPALKPAIHCSATGHIGVLATRGTLGSARFAELRNRLHSATGHPLHWVCQPCDGLADAIERDDQALIDSLCAHHTGALGPTGTAPGQIDTVVLGCTHYPFAADVLQRHCAPGVALIETGAAVARQARRVLHARQASSMGETVGQSGQVVLESTGHATALQEAAQRWLNCDAVAQAITV